MHTILDEVVREGRCQVMKKQVVKNVREDGDLGYLTLTEWSNASEPRSRRSRGKCQPVP